MTKVLVLNGSPKGIESNTDILTEAFLNGIKKTDRLVEFQKYYLTTMQINNCTGCYTCWNKTPGKCVFHDDMERILSAYIEADVIVYATPLYHFGMTALLKKMIERTLPIVKPFIVKIGDHYRHPSRYEEKARKHILISTCGFPERHHFDNMVEHFNT